MGLFETLPYQRLKKEGKIEIRKYNDFLLASTKTKPNKHQDSGFSNVFDYISKNNDKKEKISMTTPVVTYQEEDKLITGFYVPRKYDKSTVPKPTNNDVVVEDMKEALYAVIRFRGKWTEENYQKYDHILKEYITLHNYEIQSSRLLFRYQPPFIPSFLRHNEIAYKINNNNK
ncbi:MAG: heme-binding protein [Candidatus Izimaplasma sp.]|nr:heme-binding protein [Candidatus Izimaplasma bacterium]